MSGLAERLRALDPSQRLSALAACGLLLTLFLPWYEKSAIPPGERAFVRTSVSGFGSADFVMASVVLVAVGVLGLLWARSEERAFHLPGGDGTVVGVAGLWAALLVFYRVLDHPDFAGSGANLSVGVQWGVFIAFLAAGGLTLSGLRQRAVGRPEPPLDRDPTVRMSPSVRATRRAGGSSRAERQLSLDELDTERLRDRH